MLILKNNKIKTALLIIWISLVVITPLFKKPVQLKLVTTERNSGIVQLFWDDGAGYSEENSVTGLATSNALAVNVPGEIASQTGNHYRLDPISKNKDFYITEVLVNGASIPLNVFLSYAIVSPGVDLTMGEFEGQNAIRFDALNDDPQVYMNDEFATLMSQNSILGWKWKLIYCLFGFATFVLIAESRSLEIKFEKLLTIENNRNPKIENGIKLFLLLAFMASQIYILVHHELWRDEAQAYILAANLSFGDVFKMLQVEGHPLLWFLIMKLCGSAHISALSIGILSVLMVSVAVALLLWKVEGPLFMKLFVIFGAAFFYYNAVISRVYGLIALLLVLVLATYKKRFEKPIIYGLLLALLLQTQIMVAGLVFALLVAWGIELLALVKASKKQANMAAIIPVNTPALAERIKKSIGFLLPIISSLLLVFELWQPKDRNAVYGVSSDSLLAKANINSVASGLLSVYRRLLISLEAGTDKILLINGFICVAICILLALIYAIFVNREEITTLLITIVGVIYYNLIIVLIRGAEHEQIAVLGFLIVLFGTILGYGQLRTIPTKQLMVWFVVICCALTIPKTWSLAIFDIGNDFSNSQDMAKAVVDNMPENGVILVEENEYTPAVYTYIRNKRSDISFVDMNNNEEYVFHNWDTTFDKLSAEDIYNFVENTWGEADEIRNQGGTIGILLSHEIDETENIVLIDTQDDPNYSNESYWYYQWIF